MKTFNVQSAHRDGKTTEMFRQIVLRAIENNYTGISIDIVDYGLVYELKTKIKKLERKLEICVEALMVGSEPYCIDTETHISSLKEKQTTCRLALSKIRAIENG